MLTLLIAFLILITLLLRPSGTIFDLIGGIVGPVEYFVEDRQCAGAQAQADCPTHDCTRRTCDHAAHSRPRDRIKPLRIRIS